MIRLYRPSDKPTLLELIRLNTPRYFAPEETVEYDHYLDHELERYYVAEKSGTVVAAGGINYFPKEKTARISWDLVHPDCQGEGIGRKLLLHRIDEIKKQPDIDRIVVRTTQLVFPFYEKCGFVLEKTTKDYWAAGFDLYQMVLLQRR